MPWLRCRRSLVLRAVLAGLAVLPQPGNATTVSFEGDWSPNQTIPDGDSNGIASNQTIIADFRTIGSVTVRFSTTGGWNGDLYAYLLHDSGNAILLNRPGKTSGNPGGSDNVGFNVSFADSAAADIHTDPAGSAIVTGSWQPDGRIADPDIVLDTSPRTALLSSFNGLDPGGSWTLYVADVASGDSATLTSWGLTMMPPDILNVSSGTTTFSNTKNAYNGPVNVSGGATLEVAAAGTMTAMTAINVNGGTLLLSGSGTERVNDGNGEAPLALLSGGALLLDGSSITESFGTLTVTSGGKIDFGSGTGRVNFSDSSARAWSGVLAVWNWSGGNDQLFFGNSSGGLTSAQAAMVQFYSDNGQSFLGFGGIQPNGSVVPVPEMTALLVPGLLLPALFARRRPRSP